MIRVALVVDQFEVGGQEVGCLELLRRLDRTRFRPSLHAFRPGDLLGEAETLGIPIFLGHDKPGLDRTWTARDAAARRAYRPRLTAALREEAIDACLVYAWPEGISAAREAGVRAVVERIDGPPLLGRIPDKSPCDRIICESKAIRDLLRVQRGLLHCPMSRVRVIPNAVDTVRFDPARYDRGECRARLGLDDRAVAIGAVGRLAPEKQLEHLLQAVALLVEAQPAAAGQVAVILVGPDGGARPALEARTQALGLSGQVRFLGSRRDVPEVLRALDVYALTSLYEGVPLALLEAMAMGLPVVATQIPSITEVVDGNAYLVGSLQPWDTAAALRALVGDPGQRARLGRRSRHLACRWGLDAMVRRYETVLVEALADARPPGDPRRAVAGSPRPGAITRRAAARRLPASPRPPGRREAGPP